MFSQYSSDSEQESSKQISVTTTSPTTFNDGSSSDDSEGDWIAVAPRLKQNLPQTGLKEWRHLISLGSMASFHAWRLENSTYWKVCSSSNSREDDIEKSCTWINFICNSHVDCNAKVIS